MNIFCFGISHQTANVEVRERFAIPDSALADSLMRLAQISSVDEGVLLSTSNRTEFYIVSPDLQVSVEMIYPHLRLHYKGATNPRRPPSGWRRCWAAGVS